MMISRREFVAISGAALAPRCIWGPPDNDLSFLRNLVVDVIKVSRVPVGAHGPAGWQIANTCGFPLFTPGKGGYPAFWIRDFSMAIDSGLVGPDEIENHLNLIAKVQTGSKERKLKSGAVLPPYSIPDHVNFDGSPVFFPGTYSAGEDQGGGPWGNLPPMDDHYEFVHIAAVLRRQKRSGDFLSHEIDGIALLDRLGVAFHSPSVDPVSGLCSTTRDQRAVGFGFCDSVVLTGKLLYPSLLRWRAANELAELTGSDRFRTIANTIAQNIDSTFRDGDSGWLLAATETGRQPDVWGTLLAIQLGILDREAVDRASRAVSKAFLAGTICLEGGVRHVPTDRDASETSAWESAGGPKGSYQNGAYWHTPTGLLISALWRRDRDIAKRAFAEFVEHLKRNDFRRGDPLLQAPWECFGPHGAYRQNGGYLASVAWPLAALKDLIGLA